MYKERRKLLSQNFLFNRGLITSLVRCSSIGKNDTVLEIGPGKGFITSELLQVAGKVIAVEKDEKLVLHLKQYFSVPGHSRAVPAGRQASGNLYGNCIDSLFQGNDKPKLEIVHTDFLDYPLPSYPYKVLANLPFSIEGEIVRKLLDSANSPQDSYLIVDSRLATRLSGLPHDNQFSLTRQPWFDFSVIYRFSRSDFVPIPRVDAVLWRITKRDLPLLPLSEKQNYSRFIERGFGTGQTVYRNLRQIFSADQLTALMSHLNFSLRVKPGYLSLDQWLTIYNTIRCSLVP